MFILIENTHVKLSYDKKFNAVTFTVNNQSMSIFVLREQWDKTIDIMVALNINKIIIQYDSCNNIDTYLLFDGLLQIMVRKIKQSKLYAALLMNDECFKMVNEETKFSFNFNLHGEIVYRFFNDYDNAFNWLKTIYSPKGLIGVTLNLWHSLFPPRKTTIEEEFEVAQREWNIPSTINNQMIKKYLINEHKKHNENDNQDKSKNVVITFGKILMIILIIFIIYNIGTKFNKKTALTSPKSIDTFENRPNTGEIDFSK